MGRDGWTPNEIDVETNSLTRVRWYVYAHVSKTILASFLLLSANTNYFNIVYLSASGVALVMQ